MIFGRKTQNAIQIKNFHQIIKKSLTVLKNALFEAVVALKPGKKLSHRAEQFS